MGNSWSTHGSALFGKQHQTKPAVLLLKERINLLIQGLDNAGKSKIVERLKVGDQDGTTPTPILEFQMELMKTFEFDDWDYGGRYGGRSVWRNKYKSTDAIVFVIDSSDVDRFDQARDELHHIVIDDHLSNQPIVVYCNKQDLQNSMTPFEIRSKLNLDVPAFSQRNNIFLVGCSALTGEGVVEGLRMLVAAIQPGKTKTNQESNSNVSVLVPYVSVALDFDPVMGNLTLERFHSIKKGTECPFAKAAKLWGGKPNKHDPSTATQTSSSSSSSSLESQAASNIRALQEFTRRSNQGEALDGFCMELDDPEARSGGPEKLGECVRRTLTALADGDDTSAQGVNMMRVKYVGSRGWRFRFHGEDFFVTTFAPFYPVTSSRYAFGTGRAFLLLQPEKSFARHNLPPDTAHTSWDKPETIRDKTRVAFRKAGRSYHIPGTTKYPMAEHIVKPLKDDGLTFIRWWTKNLKRGATRAK